MKPVLTELRKRVNDLRAQADFNRGRVRSKTKSGFWRGYCRALNKVTDAIDKAEGEAR